MIPAFNEAARLPRSLERIVAHLRDWGRAHEIIVVDDGSSDDTSVRAGQVSDVVRVIRNQTNRGKGHAVRRGMRAAHGRRRLMSDADLSTPIAELTPLMARMDEGYDVVIGSRALPGAQIEVHQSWYRENLGRLFNVAVRVLAVPGLHDTQCGFKLFSAAAAEGAFGSARLDGFCFDVEALFIARKQGFRICEIPVTWRNDTATRVTTLRGAQAFFDLLRIRANDWRGRYQT